MIEIKNLYKTYSNKEGSFEALKNVSLSIADGDIFGVIGMSGAGKSTLVRCINLLERPNQGEILVDGVDLMSLTEKQLREKRRDITMIFQSFNLLMQKSNLDNVAFPLELIGTPKKEAREKALELLELVGLKEKAQNYPSQLSGGQQQRVAIARALATNPKVLLCDEATSALDPKTTNEILQLIADINKRLGVTVVIITHSMSVVEKICRNVVILDGGEVAEAGAVADIFSNPKSEAAKRLVFPEGAAEDSIILSEGCSGLIRLVFNGSEAAAKPLIASLASEHGIYASIMAASLRQLDGRVFGTLLLGITGPYSNIEKTLKILETAENVAAQEVKIDAQ